MSLLSEFVRANMNTNAKGGSNYIKIYVHKTSVLKPEEECIQVDTSLSRNEFYSHMGKMMQLPYKYAQRQFKEIVIGNTHYYNYNNEDLQVYSLTSNDAKDVGNGLIAVAQMRQKLSILGLPSTRNIFAESVKRRLTFRVTNRIFVNFEHGQEGDKLFYNVYLNYNHEKDVDVDSAIATIEKVTTTLASDT